MTSKAFTPKSGHHAIDRFVLCPVVRDYCLAKPFVTEDMPFGDGYVTFRIAGKIFCCLPLAKGRLVQLKWSPDEFDDVVENYSYVRQAWHWHKRHMIQFDFNECPIPDSVVQMLIDRSYQYVKGRLTKRQKAELGL